MNCRRVQKSLIAYTEAALDETSLLKIEAHLSACDQCREALLQLEATPPGPPTPQNHPPEFWAPMHEAILRELDNPSPNSQDRVHRPWTLAYATLMGAAVLWTFFSLSHQNSDVSSITAAPSTSAILIP